MSQPPVRKPERERHWLETFVKVVVLLMVGAFVLSVLVFGTCLLLMRH